MTTLTLISTIIVIAATLVNLYFVYKNFGFTKRGHESKIPVLDIKLENLPPYKDANQKTILKIKNVGEKRTCDNPLIVVSCSWMPSVSYKMNFPSDPYRFDPNEEVIWKFRIDEHFPANSIVAVAAYDAEADTSWDLHEQIS
jgi:hypothetical protein